MLTKIIFVWIVGTNANAFTLSGGDPGLKGFPSDTVQIHYNPTNCPSSILSELEDALEIWNNVGTSRLTLEIAGTSSVPVSQFKNVAFTETAVVGCSLSFEIDTDNPNTGAADGLPNDEATAAALNFTDSSSYITQGYIIINMEGTSAGYGSSSSTGRVRVLAHEVGHLFGLGHTSESTALMHFSGLGQSDTALHQDDIDGITYLYPKDEFSDSPLGCGSILKGSRYIFRDSMHNFNSKQKQKFWLLFFIFLPIGLCIAFRKMYREPFSLAKSN